ncbi:MAG: hypothetical protein AAGF32_01945 [Pseudomonadota bacterium]
MIDWCFAARLLECGLVFKGAQLGDLGLVSPDANDSNMAAYAAL